MIIKIFSLSKTNFLNFYYRLRGVKIERGGRVFSINATHFSNISLGENSILYWGLDILIGRNGGLKLGKNSHLAPHSYLLINDNKLMIGDDVAIGPGCSFFCYSNGIPKNKNDKFRLVYIAEDILIGSNVFAGSQCIFLPGSIVEDNVCIASNSTIKGRLESGYLYAGNPAIKVKSLWD